MSELESINERLDKYACEMLECYEELLTQRSLLDKCLDDGYLNMSKARSILGCASLSRLQIPEENLGEAKFKVNVSSNLEEKEEEEKEKYNRYELIVDENQPALQPPKWIGSLPPLSLKASHKAFARSLPLLVSIADLQTRLTSTERTYKSLMKEKRNLVEKVNDDKEIINEE